MKKGYISLNALHLSKAIYWIDSYPTLRKWVIRDSEGNNILQTVIVEGDKTQKRYYIHQDRIDIFIKEFHAGTLFNNSASKKP